MKNCLNWLKWKSVTFFQNTISQVMTFQLSKVQLLKLLKVILNTKTSSWTWWTLLTNTFQNQNVTLTNHCCFQSKTYSQSLVVVLLLQDVSTVVLFVLMTKLKSLVLKKKSKKQLLLVLKCSVNNLTKVLPEITSVSFFVVSNVMKSNVDKLSLNQVQSTHTLNSKVKFTSFLKKKVDVTLHSSTTTVHSSTSVQLT